MNRLMTIGLDMPSRYFRFLASMPSARQLFAASLIGHRGLRFAASPGSTRDGASAVSRRRKTFGSSDRFPA